MNNEKIREVRKLYDSFEHKDMSWPAFLKEMTALTSPAKMQAELAGIMSQKQLGRSTRNKIDEAVSNNGNIVL